jgi:hypothetical protein
MKTASVLCVIVLRVSSCLNAKRPLTAYISFFAGAADLRHARCSAAREVKDSLFEVIVVTALRSRFPEPGIRPETQKEPFMTTYPFPCRRCGGTMVGTYSDLLSPDATGQEVIVWRCVNCGNYVDHQVLLNRSLHKRAAFVDPRDIRRRSIPQCARPI